MIEAKKRICLVGPTHPYRGGIAHHTTLLYNALTEHHDVLFVSYSRQYPKILFPGKSDKDPSTHSLKPAKVEYLIDSVNPFTWLRAANRIVRFKPDLLVIPWWVVFWFPQNLSIISRVKKKTGCMLTLLCHNVIEHEASKLKTTLARYMLSKADRIITQSKQETTRVRELLGEDAPVITGFHPTYAPLGVKEFDQNQARSILDIKGKVLLFFGFVRPYKGLDVLLSAMPRVLAHHNAVLLIVGEFWKDKGVYLEQIKRLGIGNSVKIFDDYVPNEKVGLYFAAADLVVQPYRSATGSGISQLAYGLNKPVIATRVGSLDEVIENGKNGRLVMPNDPDALAAAIIESLQVEPLARLNHHASQTSERFSWEGLKSLITD